MIASLTGILIFKSPEGVEVEVNGVGYRVSVPLTTFYRLPELKESITLHTHTYLREENLQLFGFLRRQERQLFLLLLGVSGVGPKVALNILSGIQVDDFVDAVQRENTARLFSIPGIGKKTAARIVLDLKEKLAFMVLTGTPSTDARGPVDDALSALVNLGYQRIEAKHAIEKVEKVEKASTDTPSVEELIKGALNILKRG